MYFFGSSGEIIFFKRYTFGRSFNWATQPAAPYNWGYGLYVLEGSRKGGVVLFVHRFTQRDSYRSFPLGLLNSFQVVSYVLLQAERRSLAAAGPVITLFPLRCIWASLEAIAFCSSVSMTP